MPRKKGKPHAESELKKTISVSVTPSAHTSLKKIAEEWGFVSFSAMLEDLGQQRIFLARSAPLSEAEVIRDIVQLMARLSPSSLASIIVQAGELVVRKLEPPH